MNRVRANSSPELTPSNRLEQHNDSPLEGVAANVKLLYKLVQDHSYPSKGAAAADDSRWQHRVAGILTLLDDIKSRVHQSNLAAPTTTTTAPPPSSAGATLTYAATAADPAEEAQRLRRELAATMAARKSLERMFTSLGKEKEMIAAELARKVQELDDAEEAVGDLRSQNERLLDKVKVCVAEHKAVAKSVGGDAQRHETLLERNTALSEQLLRTLDSYRAMKRKLKEAQEENTRMVYRAAEIGGGVKAGVEGIRRLREKIDCNGESEEIVGITEELDKLESLLLGYGRRSRSASATEREPTG
uniref:Uncharacterized protein n=1 Tax=Ananas comosus var. bracteatus TaxID=296719 RepID=A0A6V7NN17_ANACO|nr:unnamed protein product [Ananas comosus var. bracteatus]